MKNTKNLQLLTDRKMYFSTNKVIFQRAVCWKSVIRRWSAGERCTSQLFTGFLLFLNNKTLIQCVSGHQLKLYISNLRPPLVHICRFPNPICTTMKRPSETLEIFSQSRPLPFLITRKVYLLESKSNEINFCVFKLNSNLIKVKQSREDNKPLRGQNIFPQLPPVAGVTHGAGKLQL